MEISRYCKKQKKVEEEVLAKIAKREKELANGKVQKYFQDMNKLGINKQDAITYLQGK